MTTESHADSSAAKPVALGSTDGLGLEPERAWLVEWRFNGIQWLYLWPSAPGGFSFTGDVNQAIRFARREDADAALQWARRMDMRRGAGRAMGELLATEHEWPNAEVRRVQRPALN